MQLAFAGNAITHNVSKSNYEVASRFLVARSLKNGDKEGNVSAAVFG